VLSYSLYLAEIDSGAPQTPPAPTIAKRYGRWPARPRWRRVRAVRDDEARHRDVNHGRADALSQPPLRGQGRDDLSRPRCAGALARSRPRRRALRSRLQDGSPHR